MLESRGHTFAVLPGDKIADGTDPETAKGWYLGATSACSLLSLIYGSLAVSQVPLLPGEHFFDGHWMAMDLL